MKTTLLRYSFFISYAVITIAYFALAGCFYDMPRFGIGGRYEEGRDQFLRGRGGDMDTAVVALQSVVSQDPTYKDSLSYLGRAYYRKQRYQDAYAILQRALAVNKEDEIAWIAFGVTQLQLGQDEKGLETLKGGITLLGKVAVEGYHNYPYWDGRGTVRAAIRQTAFLLVKGLEEKTNIIRATDRLLSLIDDEDNFQKTSRLQNANQLYY